MTLRTLLVAALLSTALPVFAQAPAVSAGLPAPWTSTPAVAAPRAPTPTSLCDDPQVQEVVRLTNEARLAAGVGPVVCDPSISRVAQAHGADMCARRFFAHLNPDGISPALRAERAGVEFQMFGENIAVGHTSPADVHDGWMRSPGHRRNLLDADFGRIGVGVFSCGGRVNWAQNFAD